MNLLLFSHRIVSDSLQTHELQNTRLPSPSPSPGACSNSCPLSQWCHPIVSYSVVPFSSCPQSFPASVFSNESALCIRWLKYCSFSFSISPSNEYSGLISFRIDFSVQGTLKSLLQHHGSRAHPSGLRLLYGPTLTSIHDYWENHSFDCMDLFRQSYVSAF